MTQWQERYGKNEQSSRVLNSTPRDDLGRVVELKRVPQRLVVLGPGAVETIFALGMEAKLVGRDSASDYPAAAKSIAVSGDFQGPNLEKTVALKPDLVIMVGETWGRDRVETWQKQIGAPVACLSATTLEGVAQGMQKIAQWTGAEPAKFANILRQSSQNAPDAGATALFEIQRSPLWAAGNNTLVNDVMRASGLRNAARVEGYKQLNMENLLTQQPQFYVVSSNALKTPADVQNKLVAERQRVLEVLRRAPGIKSLKCVREGRVLVVPADWALRPGPRLSLAIAALREQMRAFQMNANS